jgi:cell division septal protein FtsQ
MKTTVRGPVRRRSQTKLGKRNRRPKSYVTAPVQRVKVKLRLRSLGAQRNIAAFAVACLAVILLTMLVVPDYGIDQIIVKGNQGTAAQDVEDAIEFVRGRNVFLLRTADIASIVAKLPGVLQAKARISLPDRLEITIRDTRPEVLWIAGGQAMWVDANGVVREVLGLTPEQKLTIRDVSGRVYEKGDTVDKLALDGASQLSLLMPREILEFEFQREGELTVVSNQVWRALFNTREDMTAQVNALRRVMSNHSAMYVDVRVPTMASYR